MSEIVDVLNAISSLRERGEKTALATVVGSAGSTYRRPGARLVLSESGELIGNISGGCLDNDIRQVAATVMAGEGPKLVDFDLTADDEAIWGWGLGCNGALEVFVEPTDRAFEVTGALQAALKERRTIGVVTVLSSTVAGVEPGSRLLVHPDGRREGSLGAPEADDAAALAAGEALDKGSVSRQTLTLDAGELVAFVEAMVPPLRLVVFGAGEDALAMVRLGAAIGWEVVVVDDRENLLNRERFPEASEFVHLEDALEAARTARIDTLTCAIVMSHNYLRDKDCLRSLLGTDVSYIGMLGPHARLNRLLADLAKESVVPSTSDMDKIYGPAGLDIGAEGPEEIAWGVIGEIIAFRQKRSGGSLRNRQGPTHPRSRPAESRTT
jgi:xanthine dehydrogenase accessory factor